MRCRTAGVAVGVGVEGKGVVAEPMGAVSSEEAQLCPIRLTTVKIATEKKTLTAKLGEFFPMSAYVFLPRHTYLAIPCSAV
jgi:hypothetical protein